MSGVANAGEGLRTSTLALIGLLIALVLAWNLRAGVSLSRISVAIALTLPLWAPLRGLLRRDRRTYAWATLCVIPYFVLGLTEAIANPQRRGWAAGCLLLALLLFVTLIGYLRVTRPRA